MNHNGTLYVGVDIHKESINVAYIINSEPVELMGQISMTPTKMFFGTKRWSLPDKPTKAHMRQREMVQCLPCTRPHVVSPQREPSDVANAWSWALKFKGAGGVRSNINESIRWIENYRQIAECATALSTIRHVYVADHKSDMVALMHRTHNPGYSVEHPIRSQHNCTLPEGSKPWSQVFTAPL